MGFNLKLSNFVKLAPKPITRTLTFSKNRSLITMANRSPAEVSLPRSVEDALRQVCETFSITPPTPKQRKVLAELGEEPALKLIRQQGGFSDPSPAMARVSETSGAVSRGGPRSLEGSKGAWETSPFSLGVVEEREPTGTSSPYKRNIPSNQVLVALGKIEFRKAFMVLSYCGKKNVKDVVDASTIQRISDLSMVEFELELWRVLGRQCIDEKDRYKYQDWDSGKTHIYCCHVALDGTCIFKGPTLQKKITHLQRVLGDENVLEVRFANDEDNGKVCSVQKIAREGICVGLRRYRFFVYKDGGKESKKNSTSSSIKLYFVRMESQALIDRGMAYILNNKSIAEARCIFMHVHTVDILTKYMARFSLVLSKTIKLDVDLASVHIEKIRDIYCKDEKGDIVYNKDRKALIHTDGTGFISQDLASKCPRNIVKGSSSHHGGFEPLLIQCRLFYDGCAVKGTLLINKKLPPCTIQIRPSMIKVEPDPKLSGTHTVNSLEIVSTSNRPNKCYFSKQLIALLNYGGVPNQYFIDILNNALQDAQNVRYNKRNALTVCLKYGQMDDFVCSRMILCGIPLDESYLLYHLSLLMREERKSLKGAKLPISDSYYLMGTADPTGLLKANEVCIILGDGQISGKVLVYRNPGLHFGDVHVLTATYCKEIEDTVGNAKYGIFFPIVGPRSIADEIGSGDFDGDMYWVSRNPKLLDYFRASEPWTCSSSNKSACCTKPTSFKPDELEEKLLQEFLSTTCNQWNIVGFAADSCLSLMDRLLTLGDECAMEKNCLKEKILKLIDIYYDALDAPKTGMKVKLPNDLRVEKFPHFMERTNSYHSKSILGLIYDIVDSSSTREEHLEQVWELPTFNRDVPEACMKLWTEHYNKYRQEMTDAMKLSGESKNVLSDQIIQSYKQVLYGAAEFEESLKNVDDIFNEALAIYKIVYKYAKANGVSKCGFVWKVAGRALCKLHANEVDKHNFVCSKSALSDILGIN
ncbi:hypothetical protein Sjap_011464 [Stephania japonica]|uniref:RNA-dependent RNA polymerase n=1 Tax=Stephania japonica TaxID=461633 RepID=A0AAP0JB61_9MAGN